ncbi:hypothetical protein [Escherichia coli]|uniref:hypothetical protein n=1 Tax=Escherichia coli TaxID=562 RepID=UPI001EFE7980|nr:hypothetical protein [Escherichia coli]MCG9399656.1 hypothetical protein [Escherichia coli]
MSDIKKQARDKLKSAAAKAADNFDPNMFVETRDVLALLDELEAKDSTIATQQQEIRTLLNALGQASEKRNAEQADIIAKQEKWIKDVEETMISATDRAEAAEKRIAELEGGAFNPAILDVVAERQRQKTIEGWTPEHDDEHCNGELAMAAVCYINETGTVNRNGGKPWGWPWDASWWKPNARRRNLVKAGALILAEIERIDRAAGIGKGE